MVAVTICNDREGSRDKRHVDLADVLLLAERDAAASTWRCSRVNCVGGAAAELHRISRNGSVVSGQAMLRIAAGLQRILDGDFAAFKEAEKRPWLIVRARRGLEFAVITDDADLIE